ncbi:MAG: putative selenate reductase subunit YgfK, partial [Firmicutes bacterium]|nr:putative selenate reductase subunit YgfK [Bacillota bacterium]
LACNSICENCVDVCPNRANLAIEVPGLQKHQIIHVDSMCNACGNCKSFCPYDSAPYLEKFTLFASEADLGNSKNDGFTVYDRATGACKVRVFGLLHDYVPDKGFKNVPEKIGRLISAVIHNYAYLL